MQAPLKLCGVKRTSDFTVRESKAGMEFLAFADDVVAAG